jgi:hypothetical protein
MLMAMADERLRDPKLVPRSARSKQSLLSVYRLSAIIRDEGKAYLSLEGLWHKPNILLQDFNG